MSADHPALAGLDDVNWSSVEHAFGPATDVPQLLRELTGSRAQQEHALNELHGNIWHQGTVYEATAHAVPFLARLAVTVPARLRDEIIALLAEVAEGSSYLDVHQDMIKDGLSEEEHAAMKIELMHVEAARKAVLAVTPQIVERLMADPTPAGHGLVAWLASTFSNQHEPFDAALHKLWDDAPDIRVRAAVGIALIRREEPAAAADSILLDLFCSLHERPEPTIE